MAASKVVKAMMDRGSLLDLLVGLLLLFTSSSSLALGCGAETAVKTSQADWTGSLGELKLHDVLEQALMKTPSKSSGGSLVDLLIDWSDQGEVMRLRLQTVDGTGTGITVTGEATGGRSTLRLRFTEEALLHSESQSTFPVEDILGSLDAVGLERLIELAPPSREAGEGYKLVLDDRKVPRGTITIGSWSGSALTSLLIDNGRVAPANPTMTLAEASPGQGFYLWRIRVSRADSAGQPGAGTNVAETVGPPLAFVVVR